MVNHCASRLTVLVLAASASGALSGCATVSSPAVGPGASTTTVQAVASSTSTSSPVRAFAWSSARLDGADRTLMTGRSWRPGCPVSLNALRLVDVTFWGFNGRPHLGHLVVNADSVASIVKAFRSLFTARFPIRQMRLVDYFAANDERSMTNDNSSAFNCRIVPGTSTWSQHAFGRAVDVNPLENPEVQGGKVDPPSARPWANRGLHAVGMIHQGDAAWRAFASVGWKWGGDWTSPKDYQHFSANGY